MIELNLLIMLLMEHFICLKTNKFYGLRHDTKSPLKNKKISLMQIGNVFTENISKIYAVKCKKDQILDK